MSETHTIYDLRLAFHKTGCPICALVQRIGSRYIEGLFGESMLDPGVRTKWVVSLGFCNEHTWRSVNLKLSDALGHAMLFHDLIKATIKTIEDKKELPGRQVAEELEPVATCPACLIEEASLERIISSMVKELSDPTFAEEFRLSTGLCIPHLKYLLPRLNKEQKGMVLEHQQTCLQSLMGELGEFIRKNDYRFRDEVIGKEGDSYIRAAELLKGARKS